MWHESSSLSVSAKIKADISVTSNNKFLKENITNLYSRFVPKIQIYNILDLYEPNDEAV